MFVTVASWAPGVSATARSPRETSVVDTSETVNSEPPVKSIPRLNPPLITGISTKITTRARLTASHGPRFWTKG